MSKKIKILFIIELVSLVIYLLCIKIFDNHFFKEIQVPYNTWSSDIMDFDDGIWTVNGEKAANLSEETSIFSNNGMFLKRGSYSLTVYYSNDYTQYLSLYAGDGRINYIKSGKQIELPKELKEVTYRFTLNESINDFSIDFKYTPNGAFSITGIRLTTDDLLFKRGFLLLTLIFLLIDIGIIYYLSSKEHRKKELILTGIILLTSLPLFLEGLQATGGQDLMFHLGRIEAIASDLRLRQFPTRLSSFWLYGYGYPVSIYYGDFLLYFPAILRIFGLSVNNSYKVFVFVLNVLIVLISYFSYKKIFDNDKIGIIITLLYVISPYRIIDLYQRSALGESAAFLFYPLIVLGMYYIYHENNNGVKRNVLYALPLAFGMSGLICSHILSVELALILLIFTAILFIDKTIKVNSIRSIGFSIGFTCIFSLGFIVPFLDYYDQNIKIFDKIDGEGALTIQSLGAQIGDFFTFFKDPLNASMMYTPGLFLMFALLVGILLWVKGEATGKIKKLIVLSIVFLFLASNVFPWDSLAYHFEFFNKLSSVQFPWRFVSLVIVCLSLLAGYLYKEDAFNKIFGENSKRISFAVLIVAVLWMFYFTGQYKDEYQMDKYYDTYDVGYSIISGEYLRVSDNGITDPYHFHGDLICDDNVQASILDKEGTSISIYCKTGASGGLVTVPLINYKYYSAKDDNGNYYTISDGVDNLITIDMPSNFDGKITIDYEPPIVWNLALTVSIISILAVFVIFAVNLNQHNKKERFSTSKT